MLCYLPMGQMIWGLTEEGVPIVETLITSEDESPVIAHFLDYRVCPTIGAIDILNPHLASSWPGRGVVGHNIDRCITWK